MIETEKGPGLENMLTGICRVVFYAIGVIFGLSDSVCWEISDEKSREIAKPLSMMNIRDYTYFPNPCN